MKKVYELESLILDLFAESGGAETRVSPSKQHVTDLLSTTVFDYESGVRLVLPLLSIVFLCMHINR